MWDPDGDARADAAAAEAIEVDIPDSAAGVDAPEGSAPPASDLAAPAVDETLAASAGEPETLPEASAPAEVSEPEPALVEAAAAGAAAQQAVQPSRRRFGKGAEKPAATDEETHPNAPIVVFFILLGIVLAFVFIVAAVSAVTHINDVRQAAGRDPDAPLSVYLSAIGDSSGFGVMAVLCWVGAGIIARLD